MTKVRTDLSPLPEDWAQILAAVDDGLAQALKAVDAQQGIADTSPAPGASEVRRRELTALVAGLAALGERCGRGEALVAEVDRALAEGEALLREQLARADAIRPRLAEWAGRAIG